MRQFIVIVPPPPPEGAAAQLEAVLAAYSPRDRSRLRGSRVWLVSPGVGPGSPPQLLGTAVGPSAAEGAGSFWSPTWLERPVGLDGCPWLRVRLESWGAEALRPLEVRSAARWHDLERALAVTTPASSAPDRTETPDRDLGADLLPRALVDEYLASLPSAAAALEEALRLRDTAPAEGDRSLRRLAHQLRGSGGSYGFPDITRLAAATEDATTETLPDAAGQLIRHLRSLASPRVVPHVLVVDDDPAMSRLLEAHLAGPGLVVRTCPTAADAERLVATERFDLVLLDLFLPDDDGRRLLARWRAAPATRTMPVFVLSARLGPEIKTECFVLGADAYFEKPIDGLMVAAAVAGRLQREIAGPVPPPPISPAAGAAVAEPGSRPVDHHGSRILLAEDDPMVASIVKHRLGKAGYLLQHVADGIEAANLVERDPPDLIILDVKLPGMDGLQVLRRLRDSRLPRYVPVIILTALGSEEDLERGFSLGADDYLTKPFSPTELVVRVERLLRRS